MMSLIRRLLQIQVLLSEDDAIQIAKKHCEVRNWPWLEPVHILLRLRTYEILTHATHLGGNVTVYIHCTTGTVTESAYANR